MPKLKLINTMKRSLYHISILSLLAVVTIAVSSCKGMLSDRFDKFIDYLYPTGPEHSNYISLDVTFDKYNWNKRHFTSNRTNGIYHHLDNNVECYVSKGYLSLQIARSDIGSEDGGYISYLCFGIDIEETALETNRKYYFERVEGTDGKKYSKNISALLSVQDDNYLEETQTYYSITDVGWIEFTELTYTDDGKIIYSGCFEFEYQADDGTFIKVSNGVFRNCHVYYDEH